MLDDHGDALFPVQPAEPRDEQREQKVEHVHRDDHRHHQAQRGAQRIQIVDDDQAEDDHEQPGAEQLQRRGDPVGEGRSQARAIMPQAMGNTVIRRICQKDEPRRTDTA